VAALKAGVRQEAIDIVANDKSLDGLTKEEAVIVRYGREVMGAHKLSQEAFDAALSQFGEATTIVLGALMGYYLMISCTLIATDMRPAEGTPVCLNAGKRRSRAIKATQRLNDQEPAHAYH